MPCLNESLIQSRRTKEHYDFEMLMIFLPAPGGGAEVLRNLCKFDSHLDGEKSRMRTNKIDMMSIYEALRGEWSVWSSFWLDPHLFG